MNQSVIVAQQDVPMGLSQVERVVDTFVAPTKTFEDIRRNASWWMPWLLSAVLAVLFSFVVLSKIGLPALVDGVVHQSASLEDRLANSTPEQAESIRHSIEMQFRFMYVSPVIFLIIGVIVAGIFLGTANFVFGGRATFGQMLAVWFYGTLPLSVISILTMISVYAGISGDSFNIIAIWCGVLLKMGISTVAGIKRGAAAAMVFGWWAIYVLLQTGVAAFT